MSTWLLLSFSLLHIHKMLFDKLRRFSNRQNQFSELNFPGKFGTLHQNHISLFQRKTNTTRKIFQTSLLQRKAPIFLISKQTLIQKIQSSRERTNALKAVPKQCCNNFPLHLQLLLVWAIIYRIDHLTSNDLLFFFFRCTVLCANQI